MKGQIFIVVSILIVVSLLGLSIGMKNIIIEESYIQDYFVNTRSEVKNTIELSLLSEEDFSNNLDAYILFSTQVLEDKGITQDISYIIDPTEILVNIYLEKGEEYYSDQIVVQRGVYS